MISGYITLRDDFNKFLTDSIVHLLLNNQASFSGKYIGAYNLFDSIFKSSKKLIISSIDNKINIWHIKGAIIWELVKVTISEVQGFSMLGHFITPDGEIIVLSVGISQLDEINIQIGVV